MHLETLLATVSPLLATHFCQEATLGISKRLRRNLKRQRLRCSSGSPTPP